MTEWISIAQVVSVLVFALAWVARRSTDTAAKHAEQDRIAYADARADAVTAREERDDLRKRIEEEGTKVRALSMTIDVQSTHILRLQSAVETCRSAEASVRRDLDATREQVRGLLAEMLDLRASIASGGAT